MRLTEKNLKEEFGFYPIWTGNSGWVANTATDKLGQLEDIEEELGIDLITLFKALKNGCYYKQIYSNIKTKKDETIIHYTDYCYMYYSDGFYFLSTIDKLFRLEDYGKIWSLDKKDLTKEELE